jgi:chromosome segregation ATPase
MTHEERFDRIDANIAELKQSVARLEATTAANFDRLTQFVLDFRGETVRQLEIIDNRLNIMAANINAIETRFAPMTKAMMEFGKEDTRLNVELSRHRSRMDSLEEQISKIHPAA